jgi:hypothetical protein
VGGGRDGSVSIRSWGRRSLSLFFSLITDQNMIIMYVTLSSLPFFKSISFCVCTCSVFFLYIDILGGVFC